MKRERPKVDDFALNFEFDQWRRSRWDVVLAVVRKQDDKTFEWITSRKHRHTDSLERAKRFAEKEIERV